MSAETLRRHLALAERHGWDIADLPRPIIEEQFFYAFVRGRIDGGRSPSDAIVDCIVALATEPDFTDPATRDEARAELTRRGIDPQQWIASLQ